MNVTLILKFVMVNFEKKQKQKQKKQKQNFIFYFFIFLFFFFQSYQIGFIVLDFIGDTKGLCHFFPSMMKLSIQSRDYIIALPD